MSPGETEEVKEFLRRSLVLTAVATDPQGPGNSVRLELGFAGDPEPFCSEFVYIPESGGAS